MSVEDYKGLKKEGLLEAIVSKDETIKVLYEELEALRPKVEKSQETIDRLNAEIEKGKKIAQDFYKYFLQGLVEADAKKVARDIAEEAVEDHLDSEYESSLGYDA